MSEQQFEQKIRLSRDNVLQITNVLVEDENIEEFIVTAAMMVAAARQNPMTDFNLGEADDQMNVALVDAMRTQIAASIKKAIEAGAMIPLEQIPAWVEAMNELGRER